MARTPSATNSLQRIHQKGFTLLEVLIAVTVTGLIGVGTYQLFNSTLKTQEVMERRTEELGKMQRAMALISRDMQQLTSRSVRNEYGDQEFAISNRNSLYFLELSRLGWRNPLGDARSDIQRVSYELQDDKLYRNYYRVLDRAQDSQPVSQELLTGIEAITVRFMDEQNQWLEEWPSDEIMNLQNANQRFGALPKAIEVQMTHQVFGKLSRLFDVVGFYQQAGPGNPNPPNQPPGGEGGQPSGGGGGNDEGGGLVPGEGEGGSSGDSF